MTARGIAARLNHWLLAVGPCAIVVSASAFTPACSSKSSGGLSGDDEGDGGSSSGGSSSSSSSGGSSSGHSSSGASGSSGGDAAVHVPSNIQFNSAGEAMCGSTACDLKTHICCLSQTLQTSCIANTGTCPVGNASFGCVQATDCASGEVCCAVADEATATAGTACQNVASQGNKCMPAPSSTEASAQACQTNAECVNGQTCSWQNCAIAGVTPTPQLTLCGLQHTAPFNCSEHQ